MPGIPEYAGDPPLKEIDEWIKNLPCGCNIVPSMLLPFGNPCKYSEKSRSAPASLQSPHEDLLEWQSKYETLWNDNFPTQSLEALQVHVDFSL